MASGAATKPPNNDIFIDKYNKSPSEYDILPSKIEQKNKFVVSGNGVFFLFSRHCGIKQLTDGQVVLLTQDRIIKCYNNGYNILTIVPIQPTLLNGKELLDDILIYCKRTESLEEGIFNGLNLSKVATEYIGECKIKGTINVIVKQFILEGKI